MTQNNLHWRLLQELTSLFENKLEGISVTVDDENWCHWSVAITGPKWSAFEGGTFLLDLQFPNDYPDKPPIAKFRTKVFHPNVHEDGSLCIDILKDKWNPQVKMPWMPWVLSSIRRFLDEPNPTSPANPVASLLFVRNIEQYRDRVKRLIQADLNGDREGEQRIFNEPFEGVNPITTAESSFLRGAIARRRFGQDFDHLIRGIHSNNVNLESFQDLTIDTSQLAFMGSMVGLINGVDVQKIKFKILFSADYPNHAITQSFFTPAIFHPNVSGVDGSFDHRLLGEWHLQRQERMAALLQNLLSFYLDPHPTFIANPVAAARAGIRPQLILPENVASLVQIEAERFQSLLTTGQAEYLGVMAFSVEGHDDLWEALITGREGSSLAHMAFSLAIEFSANYPSEAPTIRFTSAISNPIVDQSGCVLPLVDIWQSFGPNVRDVLVAIRSKLHDAEIESDETASNHINVLT